jgi:hypothetical protein
MCVSKRDAQVVRAKSRGARRNLYLFDDNAFKSVSRPVISRAGIAMMAGGQGQNRTADTVIFSHVLYQLSYLAAGKTNFKYSIALGRAERRMVPRCAVRTVTDWNRYASVFATNRPASLTLFDPVTTSSQRDREIAQPRSAANDGKVCSARLFACGSAPVSRWARDVTAADCVAGSRLPGRFRVFTRDLHRRFRNPRRRSGLRRESRGTRTAVDRCRLPCGAGYWHCHGRDAHAAKGCFARLKARRQSSVVSTARLRSVADRRPATVNCWRTNATTRAAAPVRVPTPDHDARARRRRCECRDGP